MQHSSKKTKQKATVEDDCYCNLKQQTLTERRNGLQHYTHKTAPKAYIKVYCTTYRCLQRGQKTEKGIRVDHKMPLHVVMLLKINTASAAPMLNVNYFATPATK